jgi:hypothetical protein
MDLFKSTFNNFPTEKGIRYAQIVIVFIFSIIPLFIQMPFKINLFLAWEGAYRLSLGQIPYKDFYLPMGFSFWIIPGVFFKFFGPYMASLIKAQVLINLIGGLVFRSILNKLDVPPGKAFIAILIYCVSFILINFWPWYNHTVFIYELIAIRIALSHIFGNTHRKKIISLFFASLFVTLSFFTKQDGGALSFILILVLLSYSSFIEGTFKWLCYYWVFIGASSALFILPFWNYNITYWFNLGQAPHNARIQLNDILKDIFEASEWLKFYLMVIISLVLYKLNKFKDFFSNRKEFIFFLLTISILIQAMLVQVTSYIPHNVNVYFHSFAIAFILYSIPNLKLDKILPLLILVVLTMFWWSADYWRYGKRIIDRVSPGLLETKKSLNSVSKYTWFIEDSTIVESKINWKLSNYKSFKNVLLPEGTIDGIDMIMNLEIVRKKNIKVLNMSELTPLAYEIGYEPLKDQPMWFHRNVSIFDKEINQFCLNVSNKDYDLVLFEVIPNLNQFYPEEVRKCLHESYLKVGQFQAPRDNINCYIEIFVKP